MIDYSVYPDRQHPRPPETDLEKADYVARICGAWDYGILPTDETLKLFKTWRGIFDRYPVLGSPAYATFRTLYGWPPVGDNGVLLANHEKFADDLRDEWWAEAVASKVKL